MDVRKTIGWNLRRLRVAMGLSQERLALSAAIDRAYVGRIERGTENVTVSTLEALSEALGVHVSFFVIVPHYIPTMAITARRLHDIGKSGWWQLLALVPLVQFVLLFFWCKKSQPGENKFGPNPHGIGGEQVSQQTSTDTLGKIEKLAALRDSGAIDEEEFQRMKAEAIGGTN